MTIRIMPKQVSGFFNAKTMRNIQNNAKIFASFRLFAYFSRFKSFIAKNTRDNESFLGER